MLLSFRHHVARIYYRGKPYAWFSSTIYLSFHMYFGKKYISYLNSLSILSAISLSRLWSTRNSAIATVETRVSQGVFNLMVMIWISMVLPNHDGPPSYSRHISFRTSYLSDPYEPPQQAYRPLFEADCFLMFFQATMFKVLLPIAYSNAYSL